MECDFYKYLIELKEQGEVLEIELQPCFILQEKFKYKNKCVRAITYKADFRVEYIDGLKVVYDVKGMVTESFKLKFKLVKFKYPNLDFRCIQWKKKQWIEI